MYPIVYNKLQLTNKITKEMMVRGCLKQS